MAIRILDLDGGVAAQTALRRLHPRLVPCAEWGPRLRLGCRTREFHRFESALAALLGSPVDDEPMLTLYGSGDFHHVSLALLRRLSGPFNLLILDKHPDWMRWIPFLHCGSWVAHALGLPGLRRVFHLGGDLDFDNGFRWLAPWAELYFGRLTVLPAVRRFRGSPWHDVPHQPLRREPHQPFNAARIEELLAPYRDDLAEVPLYISLDKDVMTVDDAVVNWDSGHLSLAEVETVLEVALDFADQQLAGMDIVGDWSPVNAQGLFRKFLAYTEHPQLDVDAESAYRRNEQTNLSLLASHVAVRLGQPSWDAARQAIGPLAHGDQPLGWICPETPLRAEPIMLVGKMVRVRYARDRIVPRYVNPEDPAWLESAEQLLAIFGGQEGRTRGEMEDELRERFGDDPSQLVHQGLAKLLEDRCEFQVDAGRPPDEIRAAVFRLATRQRQASLQTERVSFDRTAVIAHAAAELGIPAEQVDQGLFADLKSEQRLVRFEDLSAERLLQRYNVALAQAILLRATRVHVIIRGEPPQRYRQLLRQVKFHRLVCEVEKLGAEEVALHLDGPLSLFSATQKYGLQLALFLPAVLLCRDFDLRAELRWGAQKKPKHFLLSPSDKLVSHLADAGMYVPPELKLFVELFQKRIDDWELSEESEIYPLGKGFWVPDFRLRHRESGKKVLLEVLGFWRRSSAEKHLERLREHVREPFLLAVSDQLHIDEAELDSLPAGIHRFRNMPLPDEVARLARALL